MRDMSRTRANSKTIDPISSKFSHSFQPNRIIESTRTCMERCAVASFYPSIPSPAALLTSSVAIARFCETNHQPLDGSTIVATRKASRTEQQHAGTQRKPNLTLRTLSLSLTIRAASTIALRFVDYPRLLA